MTGPTEELQGSNREGGQHAHETLLVGRDDILAHFQKGTYHVLLVSKVAASHPNENVNASWCGRVERSGLRAELD